MLNINKNIELQGDKCRLVLLSKTHFDGLIASVEDGELWDLWYTFIPSPQDMMGEIERRLDLFEKGQMIPFVILDKHLNRVCGMTTYMNIDTKHLRLEIGSTWLSQSSQGTGINIDAKKLLLEYVFEQLNFNVVEFRTHYFNRRSRKGIEKLGAKLDGILRNHMIMRNGTLRDTCVYSIIKSEWPTVRANLCALAKR